MASDRQELETLSDQWRRESASYVTAINEFVRRGIATKWEGMVDSDEPKDTRRPLANRVIEAVRSANQSGELEGLREKFPPDYGPFLEMIKENGQGLPTVLLLDEDRIVVRVGSPYESGYVAVIDGTTLTRLPPNIVAVGRSPSRKYFALAEESGVTIKEGWEGPTKTTLSWPTGIEGVPRQFKVDRLKGPPTISRLIPFDSGTKALLISPQGIFVLRSESAVRLLPTSEELQQRFEMLQKEFPKDSLSCDIDMDHGALSRDGKWIACGHQSSAHHVFDANSLKLVAEVGNLSEYPHYAIFSSNGKHVAFNSCHFYNGMTIGVPTELLPGLKTKAYEKDERLTLLEEGSRVYAGVFRSDEFVVGDASGYLRAFDASGKFRWQHFIGSTIGDIDVSEDGRTLVVTTYAGFLCIIEMDTRRRDPFTIGTADHRERRRWLFWKKEPKPLIW